MTVSKDRGLFPQSLLRFLASCQRLGTPAPEGLRMYMASFRMEQRVEDALGTIRKSLNLGMSLEDALEAVPDLVAPWVVQLMRWSPTDRARAESLDWAAGELDRQAKRGRALQVALIYPIALITIGLMMALITALVVGPQIRSICNSMGYKSADSVVEFDRISPMAGVIARETLSVADYPDAILGALVVWSILSISFFWSRSPLHDWVRNLLEHRFFGLSRIRRQAHEALLARLVASGLEAHIPLDQVCDVLGRNAPTDTSRTLFWMAAKELERGTPPAEAFERAAGPGAFGHSLAVSVACPDAAQVLTRLADASRTDVDHSLDLLVRRLTPALTLVALLIASIVPVGQLLWLFRLTTAIGAGAL